MTTVNLVGLTSNAGTIVVGGTNPVTTSGLINVDLPVQQNLTLVDVPIPNPIPTFNSNGVCVAVEQGSPAGITSMGIVTDNTYFTVQNSPLLANGEIALIPNPSGVTPGTYTNPTLTINPIGQITAAANGTGGGGGGGCVDSVGLISSNGTIAVTGSPSPITVAGTFEVGLVATGVVPGTYADPTLTCDQFGRILNIESAPTSGSPIYILDYGVFNASGAEESNYYSAFINSPFVTQDSIIMIQVISNPLSSIPSAAPAVFNVTVQPTLTSALSDGNTITPGGFTVNFYLGSGNQFAGFYWCVAANKYVWPSLNTGAGSGGTGQNPPINITAIGQSQVGAQLSTVTVTVPAITSTSAIFLSSLNAASGVLLSGFTTSNTTFNVTALGEGTTQFFYMVLDIDQSIPPVSSAQISYGKTFPVCGANILSNNAWYIPITGAGQTQVTGNYGVWVTPLGGTFNPTVQPNYTGSGPYTPAPPDIPVSLAYGYGVEKLENVNTSANGSFLTQYPAMWVFSMENPLSPGLIPQSTNLMFTNLSCFAVTW